MSPLLRPLCEDTRTLRVRVQRDDVAVAPSARARTYGRAELCTPLRCKARPHMWQLARRKGPGCSDSLC